MRIRWLGHACFFIQTETAKVYIDPYLEPFLEYGELPAANLILLSQWHYAHGTLEGIRRIKQETTAVWGSPQVAREMYGCVPLRPGQTLEGFDVAVTAVETGTIPTSRREPVEGAIGFIIQAEKKRVYFTGDSEAIPAMSSVRAEIMLVPVGGTRTMRPKEALDAVSAVRPRLVIPMHWGKLEGTKDNALMLKELVESKGLAEVRVLEPGEEIEV